MTTREELIKACREASQALRIASWTLSKETYGHGYCVRLSRELKELVARAAAEDAANAPAAATDGEALFANELGGEGGA